MKKLIPVILALLLIPASCFADIDLSGMSYDDLVALSKQVGIAMMEHEDFESVVVPANIWAVGEDIPEGTWVLTSANGDYVSVQYGKTLDSSLNSLAIFGDGNISRSLEGEESWRIIAKKGFYFEFTSGEITFTKDKGSSGLGFKKK